MQYKFASKKGFAFAKPNVIKLSPDGEYINRGISTLRLRIKMLIENRINLGNEAQTFFAEPLFELAK